MPRGLRILGHLCVNIIPMEARDDFIIKTIREAGALLLESRQQAFAVSTKGGDPRDLVTSVDIEVNDFVTKKIKSEFPDEAVLSEETNQETTGESFWSIDPIDGTSNFARSIPHFAIVITYFVDNVPVTGAVFNPVTGDLFSFKKGTGAFLNGEKLAVSSVTEVKDAYVILHIGRKESVREWGLNLQAKFLAQAKKNINLASSALDLCFLAAGRVDAVIYGTMSTRDIATAVAIIREAGGEVYDLNASPIEFTDHPQQIIGTATKELLGEILAL